MESDEDIEARRAYGREQMRRWRANPENAARELAKNREYSKNNREKINAIVRRYRERQKDKPEYRERQSKNTRAAYARLRDKIFQEYGNECACCGETESCFFEIDHVNGGGKKHLTSKSPVSVYREILAAGCPPIYQLLCANCNRGRQRNGGVCPHQLKQSPASA